jgi:hypothetical protein
MRFKKGDNMSVRDAKTKKKPNRRSNKGRQEQDAGAPSSVFELSARTVPTPNEIEAVISDMIRVEAGLVDGPSFEELWWSAVFDPQGELQAYGLGVTPTDARAHGWISVWMPEHNPRAALHVVPRVVPEGWRFEIYLPGGPMFQYVGP